MHGFAIRDGDLEARVIALAWDAVIVRSDDEQGRAWFCFLPATPADHEFADRFGLRLGLNENPRVIHQPFAE
jgi:hypothetical protein